MNRLWGSSKTEETLPDTSLEVYLAERPETSITSKTFGVRRVGTPALNELPAGKSVVRVLYVSVEPAMRGWLSTRRSYVEPVEVGAVMRAFGVGVVVRCSQRSWIGQLVFGLYGWTEFALVDTKKLQAVNVPRGVPATAVMGILGTTGMTAYFGLLDVGHLKQGDVVVVSAAAGATGSAAVQIAKIHKCFVVGIAGGTAKCEYLEKELGIHSVDYKSEEGVDAGLKRVLDGRSIDVYFDNVGGSVLEAALRRLNNGARIVICGGISQYNSKIPPPGPRNYLTLIANRASMTGFLLYDYESKFPTAFRDLSKWVAAGKIKAREDVVVGLENAPEALQRLFDGKNIGKVIVRVAEDGEALTGRAQAKL